MQTRWSSISKVRVSIGILLFQFTFFVTIEGRAKFIKGTCIWGSPEYISREVIMALLVDDDLHLKFEIIVVDTNVPVLQDQNSAAENNSTLLTQCLGNIVEDFGRLLSNSILTDVTLFVEDGQGEKREFHAHKAILTVRSPVFAAMFSHDCTQESVQNLVNITDIKPEVLSLLLIFIYTGKIEQLDQYAKELLMAADKVCLTWLNSYLIDLSHIVSIGYTQIIL